MKKQRTSRGSRQVAFNFPDAFAMAALGAVINQQPYGHRPGLNFNSDKLYRRVAMEMIRNGISPETMNFDRSGRMLLESLPLETDDGSEQNIPTAAYIGIFDGNLKYQSDFFSLAGQAYLTAGNDDLIYVLGNYAGQYFDIANYSFGAVEGQVPSYFYAEQVNVGFSYGLCSENVTHYRGEINPLSSSSFADICQSFGGYDQTFLHAAFKIDI